MSWTFWRWSNLWKCSRLRVCVWVWVCASAHLLTCDVLWLLGTFWLLWALDTTSLQVFLSNRLLVWVIDVGGLVTAGANRLCMVQGSGRGYGFAEMWGSFWSQKPACKNDEPLFCRPQVWQFCITYELSIREVYTYFFFSLLTVTKPEADKLLNNFQSSSDPGASVGADPWNVCLNRNGWIAISVSEIKVAPSAVP